MNTQTIITEIDPQFGEMHQLVVDGGHDAKRAWFALELAMMNDTNPISGDTAMYAMNVFIGSTKFATANDLIMFLYLNKHLTFDEARTATTATIVDEVICHCEICEL